VSALCAERGWALIGDEVFADYPLDEAPQATHVLAQGDALTFSLGGLSKSCGLPQIKLGWIGVGGPAAAVDEALHGYEMVADTYLSVSTPVQVAAGALLERGAGIRRQILARVRQNLATLRAVAASFPAVSVLPVEGGWSAVVQVPSVRSEEQLALELLEKDDVVVHPGYFFDFSREAFIVVSLLIEPAAFESAARRMLARASSGVVQ
jgi:alanine-synthesizing transaminase